MKTIASKFAGSVIRYRVVLILAISLTTFFFIYSLTSLSFETSLSDFAPEKHPYVKVQDRLTKIFGGLNQVTIAIRVKKGDIFNPNTLNKVIRITDQLYLTDGINAGRIFSLSSRKTKSIRISPDGFSIKRLLRKPPATRRGMMGLKMAIQHNPMLYGPVVSKDFKATLIQADFEPDVPSKRIFDQLQEIVSQEQNENNEIYIAGRPLLEGWLNFYLPKMLKIFLVMPGVMIAVLFFAFRSKRGVILPMISSMMASIWGLGILALCGYQLNTTTILAPFLILALAISHSVQLIRRYYEDELRRFSPKNAAAEVLESLFVPACISLLTDGLGFLSLLVMPLQMIRGMAIAAGAGVLSSFFTTLIFIPAILSFLPAPKKAEILREERPTAVDRILSKLAVLVSKRSFRFCVLSGFALLAGIGVYGSSKVVIGDNEVGSGYLYRDSPYNIAEQVINETFSGSNTCYMLVEGHKEEAMIDTGVLKEMESLQQTLKGIPEVGNTLSLVDYIKGMNFVMFDGDPRYLVIPPKSGTVAEYLFLYTAGGFPGDFDPVVSPDYRIANIKVVLKDHRASTVKRVIDTTKKWIRQKHKNIDVDFYYAGGDIGILAAINDIIARVLPQNIAQISLFVFICVSLAYASLVAGVLLLLPILFAVLLIFGVMGLTGTSITVDTLPLAALGIGLGIDYCIYVSSRIRRDLRNGEAMETGIERALKTSGKAVFFTGATVALGVFSWGLSPIRFQARLGGILGALLILNMLGALILLPCLIRMIKPKFIRKGIKN
ncbi:MAG: efflux RND transporter permease subunit [Dissulfuribacterales bacterium]